MNQAPGSKQNFISTMLLFMAIFLAVNLFCNSQRPSTVVTDTPEKLLAKLREYAAENKGAKANEYLGPYNQAVDNDVNDKKLAAAEAEKLKLQAGLTVARANFYQGVQEKNIKMMEAGFYTIDADKRKYQFKPIWNDKLLFPEKTATTLVQLSPNDVWTDITTKLGDAYKTDKVWGLVPGYYLIDSLVAFTGRNPEYSYALAALLLAIVVRAIVWPLSQKQLMWGRKMTQLQPRIKELEEAFKKKDPSGAYKSTPEYQQKIMGMYKEYGMNPAAGCAPALLQMPLFFFVYACMVHYRFEFQQGHFLWINPATHKSVPWIAGSLGGIDYILLVIYGISMITSTLLMPVNDPSQIKTQRMMGVGMAIFMTIGMALFFPVPSAFVLYWIFTNIFSSLQSLRAYRLPAPELVKVVNPGGGVSPTNLAEGAVPNPFDGLFKKGIKPQTPKPKENEQ